LNSGELYSLPEEGGSSESLRGIRYSYFDSGAADERDVSYRIASYDEHAGQSPLSLPARGYTLRFSEEKLLDFGQQPIYSPQVLGSPQQGLTVLVHEVYPGPHLRILRTSTAPE